MSVTSVGTGSPIGLVCSESVRVNMAGIAIRYLEMARQLARSGHQVRLFSPSDERPEVPPGVELIDWEPSRFREQIHGCQAIVAQGQLANDVALQIDDVPLAIDLYDPWLIENLHYAESLGLDPYRNDHASWLLQMRRGDLFLCSSEEQRLFFLGFLTAVGRVQPASLQGDPAFDRLVRVAPFGLPEAMPLHRPILEPSDRRRLLFGGLYDWYDPMPAVRAVADGPEDRQLLIVRNPNPATPQRRLAEVEAWCRDHGVWGRQITAIDWVPYERRYDLLRDVDLLVSTHAASLETDLSLRTRFLDALLAGCPIVTSPGGGISRILEEHDAGWVAPRNDAVAVRQRLDDVLDGPADRVAERVENARRLAERFTWGRSLEPLLEFCAAPWSDPSRRDFVSDLTTQAPDDGLAFRLHRRLRRLRLLAGR